MIPRIANLSLWEWFKLRRRWMLWILLVFAILFAQLAVWGSFFSYQNLQSTGGEITVPATLQSQQGRAPRTDSLVTGHWALGIANDGAPTAQSVSTPTFICARRPC